MESRFSELLWEMKDKSTNQKLDREYKMRDNFGFGHCIFRSFGGDLTYSNTKQNWTDKPATFQHEGDISSQRCLIITLVAAWRKHAGAPSQGFESEKPD